MIKTKLLKVLISGNVLMKRDDSTSKAVLTRQQYVLDKESSNNRLEHFGTKNFFISIFILLTYKKVMEGLIHKASNYPDLLLEIPRYCCLVKNYVFGFLLL